MSTFYNFLPWARRGIASQITEIENHAPGFTDADVRAKIQTFVHINTDLGVPAASPLQLNMKIIGPGDIIGIHKDVIVKTEPRDWITNFEPHACPFIEFFEEDFPWRYSPAKATTPATSTDGGRLRPWLTLVVLKEDEFERVTLDGAPLNAFKLVETIPANYPFPKSNELWAWAHVSVDDELTGNNTAAKVAKLNTKLQDNPAIAISRLLCPRKLEENTSYTAFLIPTYETGRRSGLGLSMTGIKAQAPAWDTSFSTPIANDLTHTFPIYHEWYFRTGATGDFEYLVRQLKPRVLDNRVGKRLMDVHNAGYGLTYTVGSGSTQGTLYLESPLQPAGTSSLSYASYASGAGTFFTRLKDFINLGEDMLTPPYTSNTFAVNTQLPGGNVASDPVITPPLYGRWHALKRKVGANNTQWLNELNLDPRNRMAAALGAEYVRNNQEMLMDLAWNQVGSILEANRQALRAQLAAQVSQAMHARHLAPQAQDQFLAITGNVHARVKNTTSNVTIMQDLRNSNLPTGAESSTYRRICRPTGVIASRANASQVSGSYTSTLSRMMQQPTVVTPAQPFSAPSASTVVFQTAALNTAINSVQNATIPSNINFNISSPNGPAAAPNTQVAQSFQSAVSGFSSVFDAINWVPVTPAPPINTPATNTIINDTINPGVSHPNRYYATVGQRNGNGVLITPPVPDRIVPAMAAPALVMPMYKTLVSLGSDYLVPNLNLIPQNSVTLFSTNKKFIEAYMVGANYEMGRELLWREYPTDQRGTYFKHFWDSTDDVTISTLSAQAKEAATRDITDIYQWTSTNALGNNNPTAPVANLVLSIRGDFLKKFPGAVIFAIEAEWNGSKRIPKQTNPQSAYPIFSAKVDPDITFLGFTITEQQAKGAANNSGSAGWFFVILERPGEIRFGLDFPTTPIAPAASYTIATWNDLTWGHVDTTTKGYIDLAGTSLTVTSDLIPPTPNPPPTPALYSESVAWKEDAAAMAMILYQNPVKVLIHAKEMIA